MKGGCDTDSRDQIEGQSRKCQYSMDTPVCLKIGNIFAKIMVKKVEDY